MPRGMTSKEFNQKILELANNLQQETGVFANDDAKTQRIRKEKCENDFFLFCKTYLPHYFTSDFGKSHKEMDEETEKEGQITTIAGYRGLGKSVLLAVAKPLHKGLYKLKKFCVEVGLNEELASEKTESIQVELLFNKRILHDFGHQLKPNASKYDFTIKNGTRYLALGYKQPIRGKLHRSHRPDYIICDDIENHNSNNEQIAKNKFDYVTSEAYGAFDEGKGVLVWLGNLTHQKSALNLFKKECEEKPSKMRKMLIIPADDGKFNPTWPEKFTKESLMNIAEATGRFNFERHYRMNPVVEGLKFKEEWLTYYDVAPTSFDRIVTCCDPSWGSSKTSDYKAIMTIGLHNKVYYLLDVFVRKTSIIDMMHYLYSLYYKYQNFNHRISMESTFAQTIMWDFIPEVAESYEGFLLPLHRYSSKVNKALRIESLEPFLQNGWLRFNSTPTEDQRLLKDQLLGFPAFKNDDGPDALQEACNQLKSSSYKQEYETIGQKRLSTKFKKIF